jgi:predicted HicB family RNase H-like nuclease
MSETLKYGGYEGSVLFSAEDKLLHGKILGIRDLVSYEGTTVRSLEKNFREAVDDYLLFCKQEGKQPNVPYKGSFNIRVSPDIHQKASRYADEHDMKLNSVVQKALSDLLSHAD